MSKHLFLILFIHSLISGGVDGDICAKCAKDLIAFKKCCNYTSNEKPYQDCYEILQKTVNADRKTKIKIFVCYFDCYFAHNDLINEGKFDATKLINLYSATSPDFEEVVPMAVEKCLKEFEEKNVSMITDQAQDGCSKTAFVMDFCIIGTLYRNCPSAKWLNDENCNALKETASPVEDCLPTNV